MEDSGRCDEMVDGKMNKITDKELDMLIELYGKFADGYKDTVIARAAEELKHYRELEEQGLLAEQKKGMWVKKHNERSWSHYTYSCSICGDGSDCVTNYCPNCGAKMEAETKLTEKGGA